MNKRTWWVPVPSEEKQPMVWGTADVVCLMTQQHSTVVQCPGRVQAPEQSTAEPATGPKQRPFRAPGHQPSSPLPPPCTPVDGMMRLQPFSTSPSYHRHANVVVASRGGSPPRTPGPHLRIFRGTQSGQCRRCRTRAPSTNKGGRRGEDGGRRTGRAHAEPQAKGEWMVASRHIVPCFGGNWPIVCHDPIPIVGTSQPPDAFLPAPGRLSRAFSFLIIKNPRSFACCS
ncbi:hypothetical protein QBC39DRAFT_98396 [Podospora conica]|nr:hypothetical protein QBC39DRAFT_98396 [Schizothecium conicum]